MSDKVTVYYFEKYDINTDEMVHSKRRATLEAIKRVGGAPLNDTALQVDSSELDGYGFQRRAPK